ncbi:MAG: hypothetical protein ACLT3D_03365 [Lawsonibacter sp.]
MGIAVGAGLYVTGGVATVLIVLFQVILHRSSPLVKTQRTGTVVLELSEAESDPAEVRRLLEERVSAVEGVRVTRLADGRAEVKCDVLFPAGYTVEDILRTLKRARPPSVRWRCTIRADTRAKRGRMYGSDNQRNQLAG